MVISLRTRMHADARGVVRTLAPAKINLTLHIGDRRHDGFHELVTVFQAISLADAVSVGLEATGEEQPNDHGRIRLTVDGPDLGPPEENLAWRAADAFLTETGHGGSVSIGLEKRIPAGAGLGGGSSDAAAVLRCLATLTGFEDAARLAALGARLGSDIPFFLSTTPTAIGRGRGERIEPLEPLAGRALALALPPVHVATGPAYGMLAESREGDGPIELPDPVVTWSDLLAGGAVNDFEEVVSAAYPEVAESLTALREAGGRLTMLSGSGAASFAVFATREEQASTAREGIPTIDEICLDLTARLGWPVLPCRTLTDMPRVERG